MKIQAMQGKAREIKVAQGKLTDMPGKFRQMDSEGKGKQGHGLGSAQTGKGAGKDIRARKGKLINSAKGAGKDNTIKA